jgi:large subunit ribosomal protein L29
MKAQEIRDLTEEELAHRRDEVKRELFNLRLQQTSGQLEKPSRIKDLRRDVAKIETIITQRRTAQRNAQ